MVGGDSPREENPDITIGPVQVVRWPIIINTLWYSPGSTNFCQYSPISMFSTPISIVIRMRGIFPRVLLLGASGVGKSSLCAQFLSSEHINAYDKVGPWSVNVMSSDNLGPSLASHLLILSVCQKEMENGECCRIVLFYLWSDKRLIVKRGTIWHIIRRANFQLKIKNCRGLGDEGGERGRGRWGGQNLLRRPHARRDVGEG